MNSSRLSCEGGRARIIEKMFCLLFVLLISTYLVAEVPATQPKVNAAGEPAPKGGLTWSIDPPASPWNVTDSTWTEFVVTISAKVKITNLRVAHSTIVDSDTGRAKTLSADRFHICTSATKTTGSCEQDLKDKLKALQTENGQTQPQTARMTVWLVVDEDAVADGTFTGNLYIDTEPFTETKTLQLTINRSTHAAKLGGLFVIMAGVVVAWLVTVLARSRINRDQALLPVEVLRQKLSDLQTQLGGIPEDLKAYISNTLLEIKTVLNDLSIANLDEQQLLPPSLPAWVQSTTQGTAFQTFIQAKALIVDNLNVIATGIQQAGNLAATIPPAKLPDLQALVQKIDQFATTLPQSSVTLQAQIKALFDAWNAAPQAQGLAAVAQLLAMPGPSPVSAYSIRMEIQTITLLFWAVWGALSILIGFTVLVMPAPGFGTAADYIRCVLWGFGLPVAGQGLQTLTMSSLNTQLGVTLAK